MEIGVFGRTAKDLLRILCGSQSFEGLWYLVDISFA